MNFFKKMAEKIKAIIDRITNNNKNRYIEAPEEYITQSNNPGKNVSYIDAPVEERSGHDKLVDSLVDYSKMERTEAALMILKKKGILDKRIAANPAARKQIGKMIHSLEKLNGTSLDRIEDSIDRLLDAKKIAYILEGDTKKLQIDGYSKTEGKADDDRQDRYVSRSKFYITEDGKVAVEDFSRRTTVVIRDRTNRDYTRKNKVIKEEKVYNDSGIEVKRTHDENERTVIGKDGKESRKDNGLSYVVDRDENGLTGTYTQNPDGKPKNIIDDGPNKMEEGFTKTSKVKMASPDLDTYSEISEEEYEEYATQVKEGKPDAERNGHEKFVKENEVNVNDLAPYPVFGVNGKEEPIEVALRMQKFGVMMGPTAQYSDFVSTSGTIQGKQFATSRRNNPQNGMYGTGIVMTNGKVTEFYQVESNSFDKFDKDIEKGNYSEQILLEDGTKSYFSAPVGKDVDDVSSTIVPPQGSNEKMFHEEGKVMFDNSFLVKIQLGNEVAERSYSSKEAYLKGEEPTSVTISDRATRESKKYVRNENGEYKQEGKKIGKKTLEEINAMTADMPSDLSSRSKDAISKGFELPDGVREIYAKTKSKDLGLETQEQDKTQEQDQQMGE